MRLTIIGFCDCDVDLDELIEEGTDELVFDDSTGVGQRASRWADARSMPRLALNERIVPDPWERARLLADVADQLLAIGDDPRTRAAIDRARAQGKIVRLVP